MSYHFSKTLDTTFESAIEQVSDVLKQKGFGILSDIDIRETLKKKLDVNFRNYRILGACNPPRAHEALKAEPHIGLMLPCNVIVQEHQDGRVEVSAVDPVASMQAIENEELGGVAMEVQQMLKEVIDELR